MLAAGFFCLLLWPITGDRTAFVLFVLWLLILLVQHLRHLRKLIRWLKTPVPAGLPDGAGVWEDAFADLYQELRRHSRSQIQLTSALERLQDAAGALPDGVVVLNSGDQIEWLNHTAELLLGLNIAQDSGQPITYLIRQGDFINYLESFNYSEPLKLKNPRNAAMSLELQLVPFGENQKLLICRDVTHLEKLETMRRDFIANVSHELRTPLTVVAGFLETLKDMEGAIPEHLRRYFDLMEEQAGRMRHLVEDLLTLSQLESSHGLSHEIDLDMPSMLAALLAEAQGLSAGRHNIEVTHVKADSLLHGNAEELRSAFGNLISNAIRYTPEGGNIFIAWEARGGEAAFSVRDTGIGIESRHIPRLTERFYRVDRSRSRETGGTGLGLSIVKHILTRHQARLEIQSEPEKGSTFSAIFPAARIRAPKQQSAAARHPVQV